MAFANLFTRLSAVEEDVRSPGRPAFTHRNETENSRKRKTQAEQTGPNKKTAQNVTPDHFKAMHYRMRNTASEHASAGFNKEVMHGPSDTAGHDNMCHKGQTSKTTKYPHVNKQQEWKKKTKGQKNQHRQKDRGRHANRGGSHQTRPTFRKGGDDRKNRHDKQDFHVKRTRFMTQEFKDQNVLLVDGRLLCRHFLWGRCIKGDDCQLEHVQGYNNLVKEVCKFYVQGLCTKGESCPYMHKSFPCKFFHRKGKCSQGADCRFSHEPLNDITSELLDKALKRENDLYELAKTAEQKSSGQPVDADESKIIDANTTPDVLIQPLRPNFYQSADTNPEEEALLCQTEELADNMEEVVPPHASDAAQPHSPPSTNLQHEEPVCYSVEAVLGPQLSKPFPCFFTTPRSQEFAPLSSSDCTSGSANQSQVPYSVDAVLRSCKSVEKSTFGHMPTPPTAQTVSYSPKTSFEDITDPPLSSETQNKKLLYSSNTRKEANKSQEQMFKSLSSLQMRTGLISKTCSNRSPASEDHKEQSGNMPESPKPQQASQEVKFESSQLPVGITCSVESESEGGLPFGPTKHKNIFSRPRHESSASKHPPQLSVLTSDSHASFKPFTQFKGGAAALAELVTSPVKSSDSADSVSHHFTAKQPTEIPLPSKETQSGTKQHYSTETTADRSNEMAHCGDLAAGCKKTLKRPFHSLFASPIADTLQPVENCGTDSSCAQGVTQSPCAAPPSADCASNHLKTAPEPSKPSASSFLSLFAAPLSAAPLPCVQPQPDHSRTDDTTHFSGSKQRASDIPQVRTDGREICHTPRFSNFSPDPKIGRDSSTERIDPPAKQPVCPVSSLVSDSLSEASTSPAPCADSPSTSHQQLPEDSSHKATANPVLRTLFLCLSPYQQDGEQQGCIQISVPSESEKMDKSGTCVFTTQQQKSKRKGRRKKKHETTDSREQSTEKAEQQPSHRSPHISSEASGGSTPSGAGVTEPQGTDSDSSPFKPAAPLTQHHTQPRLKHTSEEGERVNGSMAATPLKELFKTLDTAVFHSGH
ncbi:uncharacterized protein LOC143320164 isoform X2 [Chaetodon auriga]|uniref:uncharacterized protein LOC143320164 isoform X2 n=1 Tax=Chaetodon auriga TaxID=39042 RepID=UPI004032A605